MNFYIIVVFIGIITLSLGDLDSNAPHHRQKRACPFIEAQQEQQQQSPQPQNGGCQRNQQYVPVPHQLFAQQQPLPQQLSGQQFYQGYPLRQGFPLRQPPFQWHSIY